MRLGWQAVAALALGALSCSTPGDPSISGKLGPEGGSFTAEGVTLSVPEGALNEIVTVKITVLDSGGTEVPGRVRVSKVFQITPDTVRFLTPATVTLRYETALVPASISASQIDVRHTDFSKPTPERLASINVDSAATTVSGETNGLGTFWATAPEGARPVSLTIQPETKIVYIGDEVTFEAEVLDQNGRKMTNQTIQWSSSSALVASIDSTGKAKALGAGTSEIVARVGSVSGKARLQVASTADFAKYFTWESPLPGSNDLFAVQGNLLGLAVAGSHGALALRTADTWKRLFSAPLTRFRGMAFADPEVVAVGSYQTQGLLVRYDGTAVTQLVVPDTDLAAVWMDGFGGGMAVGDGPNLAVRDAEGWKVASSPVSEPLLAVSGDRQGNPIVVGARGAIYRLNAGVWEAVSAEPLPEYQIAAVADGEDVWSVSARSLRHFVSGAWVLATLPGTPKLTLETVGRMGTTLAVSGKDADGKTVVLVDDGTGFVATSPGSEVNALGGSSAADVLAVGPKGWVGRLNGNSWTGLREGSAGDVAAVAAFEGPSVYAAVNECQDEECLAKVGKVYKRGPDARWTAMQGEFTTVLNGVVGRSASDAWALGLGKQAYHLESGTWRSKAMADVVTGNAFACGNDLYAVGSTNILKEIGGTWVVDRAWGTPLKAAACWGNGMFVVGDYYIARTEGGQAMQLSTEDDLIYEAPWRAVWATLDGHAFIGGDARYLVHWTGEKFEAMDQPANVPIQSTRAIWGTSFGNVWAGGLATGGTSFLIHFNGAFWQQVDPGMDGALGGITGLADGKVWAGGETGALLHGTLAPLP
ncbi:MAG: Ig-like domain-containing protein [Myxococcales bacterium]